MSLRGAISGKRNELTMASYPARRAERSLSSDTSPFFAVTFGWAGIAPGRRATAVTVWLRLNRPGFYRDSVSCQSGNFLTVFEHRRELRIPPADIIGNRGVKSFRC